jgi:predicted Rossmann fold flavoprotein
MSTQLASKRRVVVIGAGAAGLLAAAEAASRGADVLLLEKNSKTGVKILMSGGTRCNITQDTDPRGIAAAFERGGRFLHKSVGAFGPTDVVRMFAGLGVPTKVESTGKIFPQSDRALHVRDALQRQAVEAGAKIHLRSGVKTIARGENGFVVRTEDGEIRCDRLIVTTGGKSWPGCGTTGDAYAWLHAFGHTIVRTRPALVPLVGGFHWSHRLSGLTIDDVTVSVVGRSQNKPSATRKPLAERRGSWLFTHFGFSGPAAMDVSGAITAAEQFDDVRLRVDFLPHHSTDELGNVFTDRRDGGKQAVLSRLTPLLPNRLAETLVQSSDADRTIAELPRKILQRLIDQLKATEFPIQGTRGFAKAEVTAGGVQLSEVDPRTMESRLVPGLYIAGEVLDLDGWIGGYNFQAAFSTGRAAAIAASQAIATG